MSADPALTRRALGSGIVALAATAALVTSGCDPDDGLDLPGLPGTPEDPDEERAAEALADEQELLDHVRRVRRRHRPLRSALAAVEAVHRAHVELLGGALDDAGTDRGTDRGTAGVAIPVDPAHAVAELVRLERSLADRHVATSMACRSGALARVVAVMSAAAAQQAAALAAPSAGHRGKGPNR